MSNTNATTSEETTTSTETKAVTPRHLQRAAKLRTKAARFKADFHLLAIYEKRDSSGYIAKIVAELEAAQSSLENAAALYEAIPEEVFKQRRSRSKIEPGMVVRPKAKFVSTYEALTGGEAVDQLKVVTVRDTHAVIETPNGERMFVATKELEAADTEEAQEAAE